MAQDLSNHIAGHIIAFLPSSVSSVWIITSHRTSSSSFPVFRKKRDAVAYATKITIETIEHENGDLILWKGENAPAEELLHFRQEGDTFKIIDGAGRTTSFYRVIEKPLS